MQKRFYKLFIIHFITLLASYSTVANGQVLSQKLQKADSLFNNQQYTDAYEQYEAVLATGSYSLQMLLKMAYIQEEMGNFPQSIYFLSLYDYEHPQENIRQKIEEMAVLNSLEGYQASDYEYFSNLLHTYRLGISIIGVLLIVAGIIMLIWLKRQKSHLLVPSVLVGLLSILFFIFINTDFSIQKGIVQSEEIFIMEAPAAGAEIVEKVAGGHQVEVLGKSDIWYEIKWKGEKAYIRESKLWLIGD